MSRPLRAALALSALLALGLRADVRPLSEAERAATRVVADYLARGPQAVAGQLAAGSTLNLEEIETRLGPPNDSTWELQTIVPAMAERAAVFAVDYPTGVDDSIVLEMKKEGSDYRVADIRVLAQKSRTPQVFPPVAAAAAASAEPTRLPAIATLIAGLLAATLAAAGASMKRKALVALGMSIAIGGAALAFLKDDRFARHAAAPTNVAKPVTTELQLRPLLALRRALATGGDVDALYAAAPRSGEVGRVADLWKAQWDLQQSRTDQVARSLNAFPSPSEFPLAEILRARLALTKSDEANSVVAYEHAVNLGPGRDGLWLETAQALMALGFEDRAAGYLQRLDRIGSRKPDAHYTLCLLAAQKGRAEESEAHLKRAWAMRPAQRSQLVEAGALWSVLRRESTVNVIGLSAPTEATFASPETSTRAIELPAGAQAWVSGDFMYVQIGNQQLSVPGGAAIAPAGTRVADAAEWQRDRDERSLNELPQLLSNTSGAGAFAQPASRERIVRTASALARRNRWEDLLKLTDGMSPTNEHVPPTLFFLRSEALKRSDRVLDAKHLLTSVAASKVLQRQNDSQALAELGSSLAALDEFELGVKMLDKSAAMRPNPMLDEQVRQIQMNKRLANSYTTYTTTHFELHVPQEMNAASANMVGEILEKELARMQAWVPVPDFKRVVVNIVWWDEFRATYTGSDFIVGFYTGKITLPFAGVMAYEPEIVAILSHELCHAMIAQRTRDQAPHWFQEGLAQRIEMKPYSPNAFNMYTDDRLLAVSLLDAVLRGSPDPGMISEAYIESQTIIRYVEAKYGRAGVTKMLDAFRDGATTEDAIQRLTGNPVAQFDTDLRAWGRNGTKVFEDHVLIRYDGEEN